MVKDKLPILISLILLLANTTIFCTVANLDQTNNVLTEGASSLSLNFENSAKTSSSSSDSLNPYFPNWIAENVVWIIPSTIVGVAGIITAFALLSRFLNLDQWCDFENCCLD